MLRKMFNARDQQQIILLTNKLNRMLMKERRDISTFLMEAIDMKNQLKALGEVVIDKTLINIVVNALLWSYKLLT